MPTLRGLATSLGMMCALNFGNNSYRVVIAVKSHDRSNRSPTALQHSCCNNRVLVRGGASTRESRTAIGQKHQPELGASLRPRASYHLARKTFHASTIMAVAISYSATRLPRRKFAKGMLALDTFVVAAELLRLRVRAVNRAMLSVFGAFMRVHELKKFSGIMYCLAGLGLTAALFPTHIALLGMLQLALGDPVAALFGHATRSVRWSRLRSGKGALGALGCACVLSFVNAAVLMKATFNTDTLPPPTRGRLVMAGVLLAMWTAVVEAAVPSPQKTLPCDSFPLALDDNAVLPVLGAVGAAVVFMLLGMGGSRACRLRPWIFW